ncbi:MAG TPA: zinc-finger domain-containing protein [Noviherbaspirillum sp.]|nr:zinc-finger domain-containing protein [Noviherbaspirillum sp.]
MNPTKKSTSYVEVDGKDLPAYCPNPAMPIWSSHPRVFIPVDSHEEGKCPYCGTVYRLKPGTVVKGH